MLHSIGLQRIRHNWATEQQQQISLSLFKFIWTWTVGDTIWPSHLLHLPSSFAFSLYKHWGLFPICWLLASGRQSIGASASASASVLPMNIQGWFPLGMTGLIFLQSERLSRVFLMTLVIVSLSCTSPYAMTSLWYMKGKYKFYLWSMYNADLLHFSHNYFNLELMSVHIDLFPLPFSFP